MIKVKVEVLPQNVDEVARAAVQLEGQDGAPMMLESGGRSSFTFDLEEEQELVVSGKTVGRMVLDRDQRATKYEYAEGEEPVQQSAYDPEKDPVEQERRKKEEGRRQGRRSPSAFVDPNAKPMKAVESTGFTPIDQPGPPPTQETETQIAARRMREELQKRDTTDANRPTSDSTVAGTEASKQATVPAQPVSPASRPTGAEAKVGSTEPVAASAPGGAASSKDVKDEGAKGST